DGGKARAIIVNSGNANAGTGEKGLEDCLTTAQYGASLLNIDTKEILLCSTGIIGLPLPMDKLKKGIKEAVAQLRADGGHDSALAIMTTDTFPKERVLEFDLGGQKARIAAIAKGSGMIHPNMATMLGFIITDVSISSFALHKALFDSVNKSFNMVSVDGDTSTNDTVLALANGRSGNDCIDTFNHPLFADFQEALQVLCIEMAKDLARDGEGATKLLQARVINAPSYSDAVKAAKAVISSSLVKAAFFGEDANWGRVICALGYCGAELDVNKVDIDFISQAGREAMMRKGMGLAFDEENAAAILHEKEIEILIDLHDGSDEAMAWGCDLTYDYVK
ncbi:MAG: bifunctional glutamate N-acetyltransferase/amino-acid acetyltransferase ArgJ, partial [Clostridiales bacterium]